MTKRGPLGLIKDLAGSPDVHFVPQSPASVRRTPRRNFLSEAVRSALRFIAQCRHARVVICTPVEFFDNGPDLPPTEEHVSHWTPDMLKRLGRPVEHLATEHGALLARLGPAW